ncbi:type IV toxin-antitoxin system AbiEi family antitoxin domain-containing protein [Sinomonas sp.]|uniref:type IV toxin-antitoxin system AbiEi family antitoxin domain-containing protein n=1 Tax=Sinomonas sp. TaxID=1914986 RepID=UPI003F800FD6
MALPSTQLKVAGVDHRALTAAVREGVLIRVRRGLYVRRDLGGPAAALRDVGQRRTGSRDRPVFRFEGEPCSGRDAA